MSTSGEKSQVHHCDKLFIKIWFIGSLRSWEVLYSKWSINPQSCKNVPSIAITKLKPFSTNSHKPWCYKSDECFSSYLPPLYAPDEKRKISTSQFRYKFQEAGCPVIVDAYPNFWWKHVATGHIDTFLGWDTSPVLFT